MEAARLYSVCLHTTAVPPGIRLSNQKRPNVHIVRLVHKNHIIRTWLMYHAACKVEFQPFKRSYSQLTFFNFYKTALQKRENTYNIARRKQQSRGYMYTVPSRPKNKE